MSLWIFRLEVESVENDVLVGIDYMLNSSRVPDVKNAWGDCAATRQKIHTSSISLNLEFESPKLLSNQPELIANILHTWNDDMGLSYRTVDSASSLKMLRNRMADPDDDYIDVSNVVRQRYDPSYYTIYLEEISEYNLHEDEHGKDYAQCDLYDAATTYTDRFSMEIVDETLFKVGELEQVNDPMIAKIDETRDINCGHGNKAQTIRAAEESELDCEDAEGPMNIADMSDFC
ncbi:hypothetical protein SASPL_132776 [Salvia splendens]|uniref:Uncharacterized protein n=1 Tax=Salvia splendens TaxID=180675 RepID=A0A8X8X1Q5_SALSN|nr:hypothetical protein SASPL_132776 [Salvia splendens]